MEITEKYRPKKLADVVGQTTAIRQIRRIIESRGCAGLAWWLTGATGTGKTTIARILAEDFAGTEFTISEFTGRDLSVDNVREIERRMTVQPMGQGRATIINESQDLSTAVVALLLATVEKVKLSKFDTIIFTAMIDVEEKNCYFKALATRCYQPELSDTKSLTFRSEVVDFVSGIAALEGIKAVDIESLCDKADWSIRGALSALDMQERIEEGKQDSTWPLLSISECNATRTGARTLARRRNKIIEPRGVLPQNAVDSFGDNTSSGNINSLFSLPLTR